MKKTIAKLILFFAVLTVIVVISGYFMFRKKISVRPQEAISRSGEQQKDFQKNSVRENNSFDNSAATPETTPEMEKENSKQPVLQKSETKQQKKEIVQKDYDPSIVEKFIDWGFEKTGKQRKIDTIIIHSSYDALGKNPYSTKGLLDEYRQYGVAAHYLINRKGVIYQLVPDQNIAYHAGASKTPDNRTNVNNFSLGVELMNTRDDNYSPEQYSALNKLTSHLRTKYSIKYVLGHNQIAPGRKTDPWNFDWDKLKF